MHECALRGDDCVDTSPLLAFRRSQMFPSRARVAPPQDVHENIFFEIAYFFRRTERRQIIRCGTVNHFQRAELFRHQSFIKNITAAHHKIHTLAHQINWSIGAATSIFISGCHARNSGSAGINTWRPNAAGTSTRKRSAGVTAAPRIWVSSSVISRSNSRQ